ncbi:MULTISPECIES: adenylate/guanylate cyclase domain-containing protein [Rhizobium/Agrobacterium group]|uniref:Adenylate cyclase n=2 Tax=Rhizobium/Agrobacterium group TaxID=227290 RepID=B9K1F1_ALLAM|nr:MULTISPECIES: adenylate/guanylate cyclase domain-containing protein [Rhizobium/Agrobacterium group]ACM38699.1 adenylate cyclase [Allorhizobium ampelinum S4]MUO26602.1 2Fe-2S iron-sulfur cluster binding domain-containing protein [Agrobacterium vitis]MUO41715.1 2Fe-2S iron-sulfur cluster binding domain-containing protein [Agrobacterium vitis]MUP10215.1 2Fe-2S iron-sulfur cluster binding domain-containing protein [Agrobacterium vitis]
MAVDVKKSLWSERRIRKARLGSGLVIFLFLAMHMANHATGLISVDFADRARLWFLGVWRTPPGTVLLYGSMLTHMGLALRAVYIRRSFTMPKSEALQIVLGLVVPLLIIDHIVATRIASSLFHLRDNYQTVVHSMWTTSPVDGWRQSLAIVILWLHGCIGIHFWLRFRPWYERSKAGLLTVAILLPILSLLGFVEMGRTIASPAFWLSGYPGGYYDPTALTDSEAGWIQIIRLSLYGLFFLSIGMVVALRVARRMNERAHLITVRYPNGEAVSVPRGFTLLEASRLAGQPHYAVCGGKGQCSTCRVQVIDGEQLLPPAETLEQGTLNRIKAGPGVRLACQLRPMANLTVMPLMVAMPQSATIDSSHEVVPGRERDIAVLFCDLRHFTMLTESRLPFDIVFLLNRYFAVVGHAVEEAGGRLDKFIGDGAMALFGVTGSTETACRQALKAASGIIAGLEELNRQLANELTVPLRIAIGIHTGPAVVGTLGYGSVRNLTAIGDTVNVASRLESVAKEFETQLVISEPVATLAGLVVPESAGREISIRGRAELLKVFILNEATRNALNLSEVGKT